MSDNKVQIVPKNAKRPKKQKRSKQQQAPASKKTVIIRSRVNRSSLKEKSQLDAVIGDAVSSILEAKPFLLPRALPTHVVPIHTNITLTVANTDALVVAVSPSLVSPIRIISTTAVNTLTYIPNYNSEVANENDFVPGPCAYKPILTASDGSKLLPNNLLGPGAIARPAITDSNGQLRYADDIEFPSFYIGTITSYNAAMSIAIDNLEPITSTWTPSIYMYDADLNQVGVITAQSIATGGTTNVYSNFTGAIVPHVYFNFGLIPGGADEHVIERIDSRLLAIDITALSVTDRRLKPIGNSKDWDSLVNSSSQWVMTGASVHICNTASALVDGGNAAIALLPSGGEYFPVPTLAFDQISTLPYNCYTGPARKGLHCSYLADDLSQYFFKPTSSPSYIAPTIVASFRANTGNVSASVSVQIKVNFMWEFISSDLTRSHHVSPGHAAMFEAMVRAIVKDMSEGGLASCNPDHMTKIRRYMRSVASDPTVRALAKQALTFAKGAATALGPVLLGALI